MIKFNGFKPDDTRQIVLKTTQVIQKFGVENANQYHQLVTCDLKPLNAREVFLRKLTPRLQDLIKNKSIRAFRTFNSLIDDLERDLFGASVKDFEEDPDMSITIYEEYCEKHKAA